MQTLLLSVSEYGCDVPVSSCTCDSWGLMGYSLALGAQRSPSALNLSGYRTVQKDTKTLSTIPYSALFSLSPALELHDITTPSTSQHLDFYSFAFLTALFPPAMGNFLLISAVLLGSAFEDSMSDRPALLPQTEFHAYISPLRQYCLWHTREPLSPWLTAFQNLCSPVLQSQLGKTSIFYLCLNGSSCGQKNESASKVRIF